jgi:hypothetical protein
MQARLSELRPIVNEHARLQMALDALDGLRTVFAGSPDVGPARAGGSRARRTGPANPPERAPRGANRKAVLQAVCDRPGASSAEIAAVSGVERNALYGVLRRLIKDGEVRTRELPTGRTGYTPGIQSAGRGAAHVEPHNDPTASSVAVSEPDTS